MCRPVVKHEVREGFIEAMKAKYKFGSFKWQLCPDNNDTNLVANFKQLIWIFKKKNRKQWQLPNYFPTTSLMSEVVPFFLITGMLTATEHTDKHSHTLLTHTVNTLMTTFGHITSLVLHCFSVVQNLDVFYCFMFSRLKHLAHGCNRAGGRGEVTKG